jgi:hypothetical protein
MASLWLLLTDTTAWQELAVGAAVDALGASLAALIRFPAAPRASRRTLALARLGPGRLGRPLLRLAPDTWLLTRLLATRLLGRRPSRGRFRAARHRPDEPLRSAAGRLAIELWSSLTPTRYVVGIDEEEGVILVHELGRRETPVAPLERR